MGLLDEVAGAPQGRDGAEGGTQGILNNALQGASGRTSPHAGGNPGLKH